MLPLHYSDIYGIGASTTLSYLRASSPGWELNPHLRCFLFGTPHGTWTHNLSVKSRLLYHWANEVFGSLAGNWTQVFRVKAGRTTTMLQGNMEYEIGFEPMLFSFADWRLTTWLFIHLVPIAGLEPTIYCLQGNCNTIMLYRHLLVRCIHGEPLHEYLFISIWLSS